MKNIFPSRNRRVSFKEKNVSLKENKFSFKEKRNFLKENPIGRAEYPI
jgi:hypothetical protein